MFLQKYFLIYCIGWRRTVICAVKNLVFEIKNKHEADIKYFALHCKERI